MTTQLLLLVVLLALLLLWRLAWRNQPMLALGIGVGVLLGCVIGATVDAPKLDSIPIWLPPLPFAVVAVVLFFFGIVAWFWGKDRQDGDPQSRSDPSSSH
jgi:hypothetical protein